eukprot:961077-Amphidinium_carterae.1
MYESTYWQAEEGPADDPQDLVELQFLEEQYDVGLDSDDETLIWVYDDHEELDEGELDLQLASFQAARFAKLQQRRNR